MFIFLFRKKIRHWRLDSNGDGASNATEENSSVFSNPNALVALRKNVWAAKLRSNEILPFLTAGTRLCAQSPVFLKYSLPRRSKYSAS